MVEVVVQHRVAAGNVIQGSRGANSHQQPADGIDRLAPGDHQPQNANQQARDSQATTPAMSGEAEQLVEDKQDEGQRTQRNGCPR